MNFGKDFGFQNLFIKKKLNRWGLKLLRHIGSFSVEFGLLQQTGSFQYVIRTEELAILCYIQTTVAQWHQQDKRGFITTRR